jgi:uncharacterized protein
VLQVIDLVEIKAEIVTALKPLNPVEIILFGSYAYGTPTDDSDLDICVVENDYKNKWEEKSKIRKALKNINIAKDIMVETENFLAEHSGSNWINSAWYDIANKGVVLYEKK